MLKGSATEPPKPLEPPEFLYMEGVEAEHGSYYDWLLANAEEAWADTLKEDS